MMVASQPGGPQKYWPCGSSHRTFWGTASQNDAKNVKIEGKKMWIKRAMREVIVRSTVEQESSTVAKCREKSKELTLINQVGLCQTSQDTKIFQIF